MTTKTCTACASNNPPEAAFCSQCGSPFDPPTEKPAPSPIEPESNIVETPPPAPPSPSSSPASVEQSSIPVVGSVQPRNQPQQGKPCLVKVAGGFFGCLFGLIAGLCLSLVCVMPVAYAFSRGGGGTALQGAIIAVVLLVIFTIVMGIINGPYLLGELLSAIGATIKWMTGSNK